MATASWHRVRLAESDDTVIVEGNHHFPPDSVQWQYFRPSAKHTVCRWKGTASYHTVVVDGAASPDAAWHYPEPFPAARQIRGRVAFWRGVEVKV